MNSLFGQHVLIGLLAGQARETHLWDSKPRVDGDSRNVHSPPAA